MLYYLHGCVIVLYYTEIDAISLKLLDGLSSSGHAVILRAPGVRQRSVSSALQLRC